MGNMMPRPYLTTRRRFQAIAAPLATVLVATMVAGCVLNKPPDTAAVKELALPGLQTPAQWTAAGAGAGERVRRQLARGIPRRSVDSGRRRSDRS